MGEDEIENRSPLYDSFYANPFPDGRSLYDSFYANQFPDEATLMRRRLKANSLYELVSYATELQTYIHMVTFKLTGEHVKLIQAMHWHLNTVGAPFLDYIRPYGNSDYHQDIADILEWTVNGPLSKKQLERATMLHSETGTALKIIIQTKSFKPGTYVLDDNKWKRQ